MKKEREKREKDRRRDRQTDGQKERSIHLRNGIFLPYGIIVDYFILSFF